MRGSSYDKGLDWQKKRVVRNYTIQRYISDAQQDVVYLWSVWNIDYLRPVLGRPLLPLLDVLGRSSFISDCRMLSSVYARYTWDRSTSNGYRRRGQKKSKVNNTLYLREREILHKNKLKHEQQSTKNLHLFLFCQVRGSVFSCCCQCMPHISEKRNIKVQRRTLLRSGLKLAFHLSNHVNQTTVCAWVLQIELTSCHSPMSSFQCT